MDILSLFFSAIALLISGLAFYYSHLKASKIVGYLPRLLIYTMSSNNDGIVTDRKFIPVFWLTNTGVQSGLIKKIRMKLVLNGSTIYSYPTNSIPKEAVLNYVEFNEYGRLNAGNDFLGFILSKDQIFQNYYIFNLKTDTYRKLRNHVKTSIEIMLSENNWQEILDATFDFGSHPIHLQPQIGKVGKNLVRPLNFND